MEDVKRRVAEGKYAEAAKTCERIELEVSSCASASDSEEVFGVVGERKAVTPNGRPKSDWVLRSFCIVVNPLVVLFAFALTNGFGPLLIPSVPIFVVSFRRPGKQVASSSGCTPRRSCATSSRAR